MTRDVETFFKLAQSCERLGKKGHMVLTESFTAGARSSVGLACRLAGGYLCSVSSFRLEAPEGVQYSARPAKKQRTVAVTDAFDQECAGVTEVLRAAAARPGASLTLLTEPELKTKVKKLPAPPPKVSTHHGLAVGSEEEPQSRAVYGKRNAEAANVVRLAGPFFGWFEEVVRDAVPPGEWPADCNPDSE